MKDYAGDRDRVSSSSFSGERIMVRRTERDREIPGGGGAGNPEDELTRPLRASEIVGEDEPTRKLVRGKTSAEARDLRAPGGGTAGDDDVGEEDDDDDDEFEDDELDDDEDLAEDGDLGEEDMDELDEDLDEDDDEDDDDEDDEEEA
jgi:hypothetical protein